MSTTTKQATDLSGRVAKTIKRLETFDQQARIEFWKQCVRDIDGRWAKYTGQKSAYGVPYFHGTQTNIHTLAEELYLRANRDARLSFYEHLGEVESMDLPDFLYWLETLRCLIEYRAVPSQQHECGCTAAHSEVVQEQVIPLAATYNDPYVNQKAFGPIFKDFPKEALPRDKAIGTKIHHHYPPLEYQDVYIGEALTTLKRIVSNKHAGSKDYVYDVAYFFQLLINLHLFAAINMSLYMNMANGLLEIAGLTGISHGILDFVAFRLQPENFQRYFYSQVSLG